MKFVVRFFQVFLLCFLFVGAALAQVSENTIVALRNNDIGKLYSIYRNNANERVAIENFLCTVVDWDKITYEVLLNIYDMEDSSNFSYLIKYYLAEKEEVIFKSVIKLSAEELGEYIKKYPRRLPAIHEYLQSVLFEDLYSLSYEELDYLYREFQYPYKAEIVDNYTSRVDEGYEYAKSKIDVYCNVERECCDRLMLIVKVSAYQYLYARFQGVADSYSQIGLVPDDSHSIVSQFQRIVEAYFIPKDFYRQIQDEVDRYNTAINNARTEYVKDCNLKSIVKSNIKIPQIDNFYYDNDYGLANRIPRGRMEFKESQEAKSQLASVASWFVGSFWANVGKGVLDVLTMDGLAVSEISAREDYMRYVYNQLEQKIADYCNKVEVNINKQVTENQLKFKKHVNQK